MYFCLINVSRIILRPRRIARLQLTLSAMELTSGRFKSCFLSVSFPRRPHPSGFSPRGSMKTFVCSRLSRCRGERLSPCVCLSRRLHVLRRSGALQQPGAALSPQRHSQGHHGAVSLAGVQAGAENSSSNNEILQPETLRSSELSGCEMDLG